MSWIKILIKNFSHYLTHHTKISPTPLPQTIIVTHRSPICRQFNSLTGCHWPNCRFQYVCLVNLGRPRHEHPTMTTAWLPIDPGNHIPYLISTKPLCSNQLYLHYRSLSPLLLSCFYNVTNCFHYSSSLSSLSLSSSSPSKLTHLSLNASLGNGSKLLITTSRQRRSMRNNKIINYQKMWLGSSFST